MFASKQGILQRILGKTGLTTKLENLSADVADLGNIGSDNFLINGGFDFWQRGTSFAPSTSKKYAADRISVYDSNSTQTTVSRVASSFANTEWALKFQRTAGQTGVGAKYAGHSLEIKNSMPLIGKYVTFSAKIKAGANFSGAITLYIITGTQTDDRDVVTAGFSGQIITSKAITISSQFQWFYHTAMISPSAKQVAVLVEWIPSGTAGADDSYTLEQIMLNIGSQAAPFVRAGRSIGGELALCQRYYYRPTDSDITGADAVAVGQCWNATQAGVIVPFPVAMRTVPVPYSVGMALTGASSSVIPITGLADWNSTKYTGSLNCTVASGLVAGNATLLQRNGTNAGYYVDFTAEL